MRMRRPEKAPPAIPNLKKILVQLKNGHIVLIRSGGYSSGQEHSF
jgi:hypothetical protein